MEIKSQHQHPDARAEAISSCEVHPDLLAQVATTVGVRWLSMDGREGWSYPAEIEVRNSMALSVPRKKVLLRDPLDWTGPE